MSVSGRGAPSALVLWPCNSVSRAVTSSREESMTASAPAASAACKRPGRTSATATCPTPRSFSQITAPSPMGPAPNTTSLSAGRARERFTQRRATAIGSLSAATSKGRVSGKTATLLPATAFSMSRYSRMPPSAPPQPMVPDGAACGLTTTRSPAFRPVTSVPAAAISPAGSWPRGIAVVCPSGPSGMPPICTKAASVPQMPQARTRTSTSLGPGTGRSISATSTVPGAAVCTDFIVGMGTLAFLVAGSRVSGLDRAAPEEADACPERDDAHAGGGHDLLGDVEGLAVNVEVVAGRADSHGDGGVEQEQEPEDRAGGDQRLHEFFLSGGEL